MEPEGSGHAPLANASIGCAVVGVALFVVALVLFVGFLAATFGLLDAWIS